MKYKGQQATHEDKMPKEHGRFLGEENHQYALHFEIKHHPKNVLQSFENPLAHPKWVSHR
jgi:hypothetical protein